MFVDLQIDAQRSVETDGKGVIEWQKLPETLFAPLKMKKPPSFWDFIDMNTHDVPLPLIRKWISIKIQRRLSRSFGKSLGDHP